MITARMLDRVRTRLVDTGSSIDQTGVAEAIRAEFGGIVTNTDVLAVLTELNAEMDGFGIVHDLVIDDSVTDVLVTAPDQVWTDGRDGLHRSAVSFFDESAVRRLAQRLAMLAGRRLDDAQPFVDGWLPGRGSLPQVRLHAVLPPVAAAGTCLSLRILRPAEHDLMGLRALKAFDLAAENLLRAIVGARLSLLVTGATGSGKSTLLAALLGAVPHGERIVCVEDAGELAPDHPQFVRLVTRQANIEGAGTVPMPELVRQALRMRPDRLIVGEVRGAEVVDLLAAMNTGHEGGAGTLHANSPDEVPARLEALGALGGLDRAALHSQLAAAVHLVLHMRRHQGRRVLAEIAVLRRGGEHVEAVPVWRAGKLLPDFGELDRLLGTARR